MNHSLTSNAQHCAVPAAFMEQLETRTLLCTNPYCELAVESPLTVATSTGAEMIIVGEDDFGTPVLFERVDGEWEGTDLDSLTAQSVNDTEYVSWTDENDGRVRIAAIAGESLLIFTREGDGEWTVRDLVAETSGSRPIASGLVAWVSPDGVPGLAGVNAEGHLVRFYPNGQFDNSNAPTPPVPPREPTQPQVPIPPQYPWEFRGDIREIPVLGLDDWYAKIDPFLGRIVQFNPSIVSNSSAAVNHFFRLHEYGHHVLEHTDFLFANGFGLGPQAELQADCYAIDLTVRRNPELVDEAIADFFLRWRPATPGHPDSFTRGRLAESCKLEATVDMQNQQQAYAQAQVAYAAALRRYEHDLVIYQDELEEYQVLLDEFVPTPLWSFMDMSTEQLAPAGLTTPVFAESLESFSTSWGGLNIVGLNLEGEIEAVWWAPGMERWHTTNISQRAGTPELVGNLSVVVTPWDAVHVNGTQADGSVISTWWRPGFGGQWVSTDLTTENDGPILMADTLSAFIADDDQINIMGMSASGNFGLYIWRPGDDGRWSIDSVWNHLNEESRFGKRLISAITTDGLSLFGIDDSGDVLRLAWSSSGVWGVENVSELAAG